MGGAESKFAVKRLLVLGCGGFVGSHLLDALLPEGSVHVTGWDPDHRKIARHLGRSNFVHRREALCASDSMMLEKLRRDISNADVIINLAAICNPSQYNTRAIDVIYSNFLDSYRIVEICSEMKKWIIHFSTSEVYGRTVASYVPENNYSIPGLYELEEDTTPLVMGPISNQRWSYACAKQLLERFIYAHHWERDLDFTIVRPLNFFGPRMDFIPGKDGEGVPRVLACFMTALLDGTPMQLVDGGMAKRTIVSIHDAIQAMLLMLEKPDMAANQIFNIGNRNNEVTMAELAQMMRRIYARVANDPFYEKHPIEVVSGNQFYGEGYEDCDRRMPNLDKAKKLLGWTPEISLEDTLTETITYYFETYGSDMAKEVGSDRSVD